MTMSAPVFSPRSPADALRSEQVRAVGTAFLRVRPVVVAVGIVGNAFFLEASGAPPLQRGLVLGCMGTVWLAFVAEAWWLRRRTVTEPWLLSTLSLTFAVLVLACALTGGIRSPLLPLLLAPAGVLFAAFGRARFVSLAAASMIAAVAGLAALPAAGSLPDVAAPWDAAMTTVSVGVAVVLLRIGVAGLTDAHVASTDKLERLRAGALLEARERALNGEALAASVAHELRNPLTAIKGLLQLLERSAGGERERKRLDVALGEVDRMQNVLDEYLSFSRAPAGPARRPVALHALLRDLVLLIEPNAAERGVALAIDAPPLEARVDPTRLKDAILNLVGNALAAMPEGGALRVALERDGRFAEILITDTGAGMSPEQLEHAATPFVSHRAGGTGLGLAMARGVARQHGGELTLRSAPGRGTTATLSILLDEEEGGP
jgi:signal transduction histidine kinase